MLVVLTTKKLSHESCCGNLWGSGGELRILRLLLQFPLYLLLYLRGVIFLISQTFAIPMATRSPSFLRQAMSLPVSCAISSAGITTLKAIVFSIWGEGPYDLQLETPTRSVLALV